MADAEETPAPAEPAKEAPKNAAKSHFDDQAAGGNREDATTGDERNRALNDVLSMYGARKSKVTVDGTTVNIGTLVGGDAYRFPDAVEVSVADWDAVGDRVITELQRLYVEPPGFAGLGEPISRHRMILLGT